MASDDDDLPPSVRELRDPTAPPCTFLQWRRSARAPQAFQFTPENQEMIIGAIARTGSIETAAEVAGVTSRSLRYWFARGREQVQAVESAIRDGEAPPPAPYGEFWLECRRAIGWWRASGLALLRERGFEGGETQWVAWGLSRFGGKLGAERIEIDMDPAADPMGEPEGRREAMLERLAEIAARHSALKDATEGD